MSSFLSLLKTISAMAKILGSLLTFLAERRQRQAGEDKAAARSLKEQANRVENARNARRSVALDGMPDNDPYRRD